MFGVITYANPIKGYGFLTVSSFVDKGIVQQQYFFHYSNFQKLPVPQVPVLGAYCVFELGEPYAIGKKPQAVGVRFATSQEIATHTATSAGAAGLSTDPLTLAGVAVDSKVGV